MNERFGDRPGENSLAYFLDKALKNSQAREKEAEQKSLADPLTGLWNRRALEQEFPKILERLDRKEGGRESDPDHVLFFFADVDRFKFLNDTYGHPFGHEVLKIVAKQFEEEANGRGGKAVRAGGDEFAIIQEGRGNLTDEQIESISSRIQEKINSKLSIPVPSGDFSVTVSVGCAVMRKGEVKSLEELEKEADDKMYAQKQANGTERGK